VSGKNKKYGGYLFIETTVALSVLSLLLIGLAVSLDGFRRFDSYQLVRQRCTAAAQAQLDSIAVTGEPMSDEGFKRLWPKLDVSIEESVGVGQWQGKKLVKVTVSGKSLNKEVEIALCRYILTKGQ